MGSRALLTGRLRQALQSLPRMPAGLNTKRRREAFIFQLVESVRRVEYVRRLPRLSHSALRNNPRSTHFDPLKGAARFVAAANREEAFWLVFLAAHTGKNRYDGWRLAAQVYGAGGRIWTWKRVASDFPAFERAWAGMLSAGGLARFGNHRKYESHREVARAVRSYSAWVLSSGSHKRLFRSFVAAGGSDAAQAFRAAFSGMSVVDRMGRTGRFDYLTWVGELGLAPIEPGTIFMAGATGPRRGVAELFGVELTRSNSAQFEERVCALGTALGVGQRELEDALCNWQKSPTAPKAFRG